MIEARMAARKTYVISFTCLEQPNYKVASMECSQSEALCRY